MMEPAQASGEVERRSLKFKVDMEYRDTEICVEVRDGRYAVKVGGAFRDVGTALFSQFEPKDIVKCGGYVAVLCFALHKMGISATDFRPGSIAFTADVDKKQATEIIEKANSKRLELELFKYAMEIAQEFSMQYWNALKFNSVSVVDEGKATFNFQTAKLDDARTGIRDYTKVNVESGADVNSEIMRIAAAANKPVTGGTEVYNFNNAVIKGGVAGVSTMREFTFGAKSAANPKDKNQEK